MTSHPLKDQIEKIAKGARLTESAVAFRDHETSEEFSLRGDQFFHAASTFKAAILLVLLKAAGAGEVDLKDHLQVRNRFLGLTSGEPFRIARDRDGDSAVHGAIGKSLPLDQLARAMIVRSSNLATNLLLNFLTLEKIRGTLDACGVRGVEVRRGVEDLAAHEAGINNETTAKGMCALFERFLDEKTLPAAERELGLEILHAQEFNRMLPARLPKGVRVAHKTGEISTHCHDAGIVFPQGRKPYVISVLTEFGTDSENPQRAVAEISSVIFDHLTPRSHE